MAGEEEVELRDIVAHTLETKGVLGKIRAQLRANVFLALEEQESKQKPHPLVNSKLQQYLKTKDGQVATALVREFLTFFELDYTRSVFDPESNAFDTCPGRHQLARDLGLDSTTSGPLLGSVLQRATHPPSPPPDQHPPPTTTLTSAHVTHTTTTTLITSSSLAGPAENTPALPSGSRPGDDPPHLPDEHFPTADSSPPPLLHTPPQFSVAAATEGKTTGPEAGAGVTGGQLNGSNREINDMKLPAHVDDMRKMDLGKGLDHDLSYQDDFHSDLSFSEQSEAGARLLASKLDETEDVTMSHNSLGDFDYAEPAKT